MEELGRLLGLLLPRLLRRFGSRGLVLLAGDAADHVEDPPAPGNLRFTVIVMNLLRSRLLLHLVVEAVPDLGGPPRPEGESVELLRGDGLRQQGDDYGGGAWRQTCQSAMFNDAVQLPTNAYKFYKSIHISSIEKSETSCQRRYFRSNLISS